jgi:hypothetical protein
MPAHFIAAPCPLVAAFIPTNFMSLLRYADLFYSGVEATPTLLWDHAAFKSFRRPILSPFIVAAFMPT